MRKYALTRFGSGDYLCPGNDLVRLWRFHRYYEEGSLETADGKKVIGWFWRALSTPMPDRDTLAAAQLDDPDLWNTDIIRWTEWDSLLSTREEAIAAMERHSVAPR